MYSRLSDVGLELQSDGSLKVNDTKLSAALTAQPDEVAKLFEDTAAQETHHAFGHLELLYPSKGMSVADLLRTAMEGELYETNQMYPDFERVAKAEKDAAAQKEFAEQRAESADHAQLFKDALAKAEKRFGALTKIEARHAARYGEALQKVEGAR